MGDFLLTKTQINRINKLLTKTQINRINKSIADKTEVDINISKKQISAQSKNGGLYFGSSIMLVTYFVNLR